MASEQDEQWMIRALELAAQGEGSVEPNPMVGCVVVRQNQIIAEGWHRRFGGPHAEVDALSQVSSQEIADSTVYVTLEPCCHHGKTPPCTDLLLRHKPQRIVIAMLDPFPQVAGKGVEMLHNAGIPTTIGVLESDARQLNAPFLKVVEQAKPWVIAKWAMTLDGKIATPSGESRWISNEVSRQLVHQLRGRMDGILVGLGTVQTDDPLLTVRDATRKRTPRRFVLDSMLQIPIDTQLVRTAREVPLTLFCNSSAHVDRIQELTNRGVDIQVIEAENRLQQLDKILDLLVQQYRVTNLLVEGGEEVLGSSLICRQIDECHVFVAPKIFGGREAPSPIGGRGISEIASCLDMEFVRIEELDGDIYLQTRRRQRQPHSIT